MGFLFVFQTLSKTQGYTILLPQPPQQLAPQACAMVLSVIVGDLENNKGSF